MTFPRNFGDMGTLDAIACVLARLPESEAPEADAMPHPDTFGLSASAVGDWVEELRDYLSATGLTLGGLYERLKAR